MGIRIKTKWHRSKRSERNIKGSSAPKKIEDLCSVVAMNIWKLSKNAYQKMENEGFRFREDSQAIDFINEFIVYQIHICDRMIFGKVNEDERNAFINKLARLMGESVVENQIELLGPGDYVQNFISLMNERLANYAECEFEDGKPSFEFSRYLAANIAAIMSQSDDKWVVEQIMDIEAPEIVEKITRVIDDVLGLRNR